MPVASWMRTRPRASGQKPTARSRSATPRPCPATATGDPPLRDRSPGGEVEQRDRAFVPVRDDQPAGASGDIETLGALAGEKEPLDGEVCRGQQPDAVARHIRDVVGRPVGRELDLLRHRAHPPGTRRQSQDPQYAFIGVHRTDVRGGRAQSVAQREAPTKILDRHVESIHAPCRLVKQPGRISVQPSSRKRPLIHSGAATIRRGRASGRYGLGGGVVGGELDGV